MHVIGIKMGDEKKIKLRTLLLLVLCCFSGAVGLSYEIIYLRILSSFIFGELYLIIAAILFGVFLGLTLGAHFSYRLTPYLWALEVLLGSVSLLLGTLLRLYGLGLADYTSYDYGITFICALLCGLIPFFLIGLGIPSFSQLLKIHSSVSQPFIFVYGLYNVFAAIFVLLTEYYFIRQFGLTDTLFAFGILNLSIGFLLRPFCLHPKVRWNGGEQTNEFSPSWKFWKRYKPESLTKSILCITIICGIIGSVWQLFYLDFAWAVLGAFQETFSLVLFSAILGISIGSYWFRSQFWGWARECLLLLMATFVLVHILFTSVFLDFWSNLGDGPHHELSIFWVRSVLIILYGLPVFILTGAFAPFLSLKYKSLSCGTLLALLSFGNALGIVIYTLVRNNSFNVHMSVPILLLVLSFISYLGTSYIIRKKMMIMSAIFLAITAFSLLVIHQLYPTPLLLGGYRNFFRSDTYYNYKKRVDRGAIQIENYSNYGFSTHVIRDTEINALTLVHSGYMVFALGNMNRLMNRENSLPVLASLYAKNTHLAYQLGLGTGITASGSARLFDTVEVIELNPGMLRVASGPFALYNKNLLQRSNVQIRVQDGLIDLKRQEKKYDTIINTVSSPLFFSANKLYTLDFYKIVAERLASGGVYIGWFDMSLGREGVLIGRKTLLSAFSSCHFYALTLGYYIFACGQTPLKMQQKEGVPYQKTFESIRIPDSFFTATVRKINTLDRPLLSYGSLLYSGQKAEHFMNKLENVLYGGVGEAYKCCNKSTPICETTRTFQSFCE